MPVWRTGGVSCDVCGGGDMGGVGVIGMGG